MTPSTTIPRRRRLALALLLLAAVAAPILATSALADELCPACKSPLEAGAAFCSNCGRKVDPPVAAAPGAAAGAAAPAALPPVVQVVAAVDTELTSVVYSVLFESNVEITSILGSAFAIAPNEFVTDTNNIEGAKQVTLRTRDGRSYPAKVIGRDRMIGVALLQAEVPGVTPLVLRRDEPVRIGESVVAMGYPARAQVAEPVRTAGVVSGLNRRGLGIQPVEDFLQTDATLPNGVGGGPVLDARGRVVGMATGKINSGIGFAVPAAWIGRAIDWIHGGSPRAWLGALAVPTDVESRRRYNLPPEARLVVEQTFPGSPAEAAGLKPGDGLWSVRGIEATGLARLHDNLLGARIGEVVPVVYLRGSEKKSADITLVARPDNPRLSPIDSLRYYGGGGIEAGGGNTLVVREVVPDSIVAGGRVKVGDVLQSVLSKKDWAHGARDNSRWRSVRTLADLDERVSTAYSDIDFCLGLRFKSQNGERREVIVCDFLSPTGAL